MYFMTVGGDVMNLTFKHPALEYAWNNPTTYYHNRSRVHLKLSGEYRTPQDMEYYLSVHNNIAFAYRSRGRVKPGRYIILIPINEPLPEIKLITRDKNLV
jgi:hypothetical protein